MKLAEILDTVKLDGVMDKMKMDKLYERIGRLLDREKFREMNAKVCAKLVEKFPLKRLMVKALAPSRTTSLCIAGGGVAVLLHYYSRAQILKDALCKEKAERLIERQGHTQAERTME
eukprot:3933675-Pyramimonas_sp.AAC.3